MNLAYSSFNILIQILKEAGFEHYEISNFCKPGFYSRHNTSYWKNEKYLGIGPSAHSFDLKTRRWNVSSIAGYLKGMESGEPYSDSEILTEQDHYNDYIITGFAHGLGHFRSFHSIGVSGRLYSSFSENKGKIFAIGDTSKVPQE